jgi:hypothetical protein
MTNPLVNDLECDISAKEPTSSSKKHAFIWIAFTSGALLGVVATRAHSTDEFESVVPHSSEALSTLDQIKVGGKKWFDSFHHGPSPHHQSEKVCSKQCPPPPVPVMDQINSLTEKWKAQPMWPPPGTAKDAVGDPNPEQVEITHDYYNLQCWQSDYMRGLCDKVKKDSYYTSCLSTSSPSDCKVALQEIGLVDRLREMVRDKVKKGDSIEDVHLVQNPVNLTIKVEPEFVGAVYRPKTLVKGKKYPIVMAIHGNYDTCGTSQVSSIFLSASQSPSQARR